MTSQLYTYNYYDHLLDQSNVRAIFSLTCSTQFQMLWFMHSFVLPPSEGLGDERQRDWWPLTIILSWGAFVDTCVPNCTFLRTGHLYDFLSLPTIMCPLTLFQTSSQNTVVSNCSPKSDSLCQQIALFFKAETLRRESNTHLAFSESFLLGTTQSHTTAKFQLFYSGFLTKYCYGNRWCLVWLDVFSLWQTNAWEGFLDCCR